MIERYPLTWPIGWVRTPAAKRQQGRFKVSLVDTRTHLLEELRRLEATSILISSNIPVRQNGLPYAKYREPEDPGTAIYFELNKKPCVLACDRWNLVKDNLRAIGKHIEATRGITRWGVGSLEQAFRGYQILPESSHKDWWIVLGVTKDASLETIKQAYKNKAKDIHPDLQGNHKQMIELNRAWEEAKINKEH